MENVKNAINVINNLNDNKFSQYNKIYLFTTENLCYLEKFNGKNVLSVCGSGDHILNSILFGAKNILAFDVNNLSQYILYLKIEAVKMLTYQEFIDFFIFKNFDYQIFKKINTNKTLTFWEELYKYFDYNTEALYNCNLFIKNNANFYIKNNPYLDKVNYNILKENILNISINFINCDLLKIKNENFFDLILLSNISDYLNNIFFNNSLKEFNEFINTLKKDNQTIIMAYLYDFRIKNNYRSEIDDINNVNKYFDNIKIYYFKGAYDTNKQDAIIIKE